MSNAHAIAATTTPVNPRVGGRYCYPPVVWLLLGANLLVRSAGFAYPFMAYHVAGRGLGADAVSFVLAAFGVGWIVGQLGCGWLVDRVGHRTSLVLTMTVVAVVLAMLAGAHSVAALLVGSLIAGVFYDALRPITSAAITELVPDVAARAKVDAWRVGIAINGGAGIAGALGGVLAGMTGTATLYMVNAAACAAVAVAALAWMPGHRRSGSAATSGGYRQALTDVRLLVLFASSVATLTGVTGLYAILPLLMNANGLDASSYSLVLIADAAGMAAITPAITPWLSRKLADGPRLDILAASSVWIGVSMGAAGFARTTLLFVVAAVAVAPAVVAWYVVASDLVHRIAPPAQRGRYNGIWGAAIAVSAVVAPLLASMSLRAGGTTQVAVSVIAIGMIGAVLCLPLARTLGPAPDAAPTARSRAMGDLALAN